MMAFNKFSNTEARMLDDMGHVMNKPVFGV